MFEILPEDAKRKSDQENENVETSLTDWFIIDTIDILLLDCVELPRYEPRSFGNSRTSSLSSIEGDLGESG